MLVLVSIIVILIYFYGLFFNEALSSVLVKITVFIAVAGIMGILGWVGYTLATTPPPKPIEELEKEIEAELKRLEEQGGEREQGQSGQGS